MARKKSLKEIDKMPGLDFEVFVGELLTQHGYKTQNIKGSGDFGVDVIAEKGGTKYAVQVKRYKSNVSRTAISDAVAGKFHWDCEKAWVVTNSYFTSDAKILAKSTDCKLTDRDELKNMMKDGSTFASIFEGAPKRAPRKGQPFWKSIWGTLLLIGLAAVGFYAIRFIPQESFESVWKNTTAIFSQEGTKNSAASGIEDTTTPIMLENGDNLSPTPVAPPVAPTPVAPTPVAPKPALLIPATTPTVTDLNPAVQTNQNNSTTDLQPIDLQPVQPINPTEN